MEIRRVAVATFTCVAGLAGSAAGHSQEAATQNDSGSISEIVVTGSRLIANGNNSPTPVTIVQTEELLSNQPQTVAQALQSLPVFVGSLGQNTNGGGAAVNNAANVINMRNIGLTRTLVLYDGRRLPTTTPTGFVNVDMIPQMLLQRVDVVTGGASAVYGSDAISGVVNFITDTKFNGVKFNVQSGVSAMQDDKTFDTGIAAGMPFAGDRGHVEFSYQYREDPGVFTRLTRSLGTHVWTAQGAGTTASPYHAVENSRLSNLSFGGLITSNVPVINGVALNNFAENGVLSPFVNGAPSGTAGVQSGGDGVYLWPSSLKSSYRMHQAFLRGDFDFTDRVHGYVSVSSAWNWNQNNGVYNSLTNVPISTSNAFLLPAYRAVLPQTPNATFNFSKAWLNGVPPVKPTTGTKQFYALADLSGQLGDGYRWEVSALHSEARQHTAQINNIQRERLYAALDAVVNPATNQVVCNVTLTSPGLFPGCVPLNVFGPTSESAEALQYISAVTALWALTKMDDVAASLTGAPFSSWAGPINMALSGEWRRTTFGDTSTGLTLATMNCTGLRFCTANSNLWQSGSYGEWTGEQTVSEAAIEASVPLLTEKSFVKDLSINAAARYAHYDTNGGIWAWKGGIDWQVNDQLTVRATRSRDIRAPNLNDLFSAPFVTRSNVTDTLTGQTLSNFANTAIANPALEPELADTTTAGFVYRPEWLTGFSLAVDAFDTRISDAIVSLVGSTATVQRVCNASGGTSIYCQLVDRPLPYTNTTPANNMTATYTKPINVATMRTYGADVEANYAMTVFGRPASVRLFSTWQPHLTFDTPGLSKIDMGGAAFGPTGFTSMPAVRITAFLNYSPIENFNVSLIERWRSSLKWNADPTLVYSGPKVPSAAFTNVNLAYTLKTAGASQTQFFFNVLNLFNSMPDMVPPLSTPGQVAANADGDDVIGRYFTLGLRFRL